MFNPIWGFDFKVTIDNHVVTMSPGQQIAIPVRLELIRGKPQQVDLDVNTRWESMGLTATIRFSELAPSQPWKANMFIKASANTPPGSYLFTVRGSAKGTFHTSEDAVTVIVEPKDKQKPDRRGSFQPGQAGGAPAGGVPNASFDPSNLFKSKVEPKPGPIKNKAIKKPNARWAGVVLILGAIVFIVVLIAATKGGGGTSGGGGSGCPTTCPGGIGVIVPKRCPCPAACPYIYTEDVKGGGLGSGYKQCANRPPR